MMDSEDKTAILVVDDEQIVTSLICDALEEEDYQVETTQSSEHAIEMSRNQDFDLVISDIRMPRMDGIEMIKKIKEIQPSIGIIFMTGYANLQSAKNAIKQGASDYIMKPFELSEMRQAVHNAISMKRAADVTSSDHHLDNLTDLNRMLFEAGDRRGLIVASLRFAMIHQRADLGTVIYNADDADDAARKDRYPRFGAGSLLRRSKSHRHAYGRLRSPVAAGRSPAAQQAHHGYG